MAAVAKASTMKRADEDGPQPAEVLATEPRDRPPPPRPGGAAAGGP